MMSNYVIAVYVSSDPGTYRVRIQFTFQTGCDRCVLVSPLVVVPLGIY
jgi:hypothetical protein